MKKIQRRKRRSGLKLIALMVMIICAVVLIKTKDLNQDIDKKDKQIDKLNQQIADQEERSLTLEEEKAYQSTKRYIEEIARNKLNLYYPDEIIFQQEENGTNKN